MTTEQEPRPECPRVDPPSTDGTTATARSATEIESAISFGALELATARTPEARRTAWAKLQGAHAERSPAHVEYLEQRRGLRG
jgi:hypothetical protein